MFLLPTDRNAVAGPWRDDDRLLVTQIKNINIIFHVYHSEGPFSAKTPESLNVKRLSNPFNQQYSCDFKTEITRWPVDVTTENAFATSSVS